jgi:hypothetical protein
MIVSMGLGLPLISCSIAVSPKPKTPAWVVVASGLDNPRGLASGLDGELIVAESGHSGDMACFVQSACISAGLSAQISSVDVRTGRHTPVVTGLPSYRGAFGPFGLGGVSERDGHILAVTSGNPQVWGRPTPTDACAGQPPSCVALVTTIKTDSGLLIEADGHGSWKSITGVGAFDFQWTVDHPDPGNPDFTPGDANPYGLVATEDGTYVADGGSNTLSFVDQNGRVSVLAALPDPPNHQPVYDATATCVAKVGSDVYVGDLAGELYRWDGTTLTRVVSQGGKLAAVVGCTSDDRGNVYVVNLTQNFNSFNEEPFTGSIVKVTPDLATSYLIRPDEGLNYPNGIAFGADGALYVAINSLCPADLSLLAGSFAPPSACSDAGQIIRLGGRGL